MKIKVQRSNQTYLENECCGQKTQKSQDRELKNGNKPFDQLFEKLFYVN